MESLFRALVPPAMVVVFEPTVVPLSVRVRSQLKSFEAGKNGLVDVGSIHWDTLSKGEEETESILPRFSETGTEGNCSNEHCDGIVCELADEGLSVDDPEYLDVDVSGDSVFRFLDASGVCGSFSQGWLVFASSGHAVFNVNWWPSDFDLPWIGDVS